MKKIMLLFALFCIIETGQAEGKDKTTLIVDSLGKSLKNIEPLIMKDTVLKQQNIQYKHFKMPKDSLINKKIQNKTVQSIQEYQLKDMVMIEKKEIKNSNQLYHRGRWSKIYNQ